MPRKILYIILLLLGVASGSKPVYAQLNKTFTVVIDPGHGGKDSGTTGTKHSRIYEKDVVLSVGKLVDSILRKTPGIKVIMTRRTDKFIELRKRAEIANKAKADVFVSIHCNANPNKKARGSETYVLGIHRNKDNLEVAKKENSVIKLEKDYKLHYQGFNPDSPETFIGLEMMQEEYLEQSILLASLVQQEYQKRVKTYNRSVQQAGFAVLRLTYMPSILTEIGFLSNPEEAKFLKSKAGQLKIARSIADAIIKYRNLIRENTEVPDQETKTDEQRKNSALPQAKTKSGNKSSHTTVSASNNSHVKSGENTYLSVQLMISSRKIPTTSRYFKGLKNVFYIKVGRIYKYYYGKVFSMQDAQKKQQIARRKGFKGAFIVGFKNGKRVKPAEIF